MTLSLWKGERAPPNDDEAFWTEYRAYLQSPAWERRRELVRRRAAGICEGCGMRRGTQAHHVTYQHVFRELLFELRWVCDDCHAVCHDEKPKKRKATLKRVWPPKNIDPLGGLRKRYPPDDPIWALSPESMLAEVIKRRRERDADVTVGGSA